MKTIHALGLSNGAVFTPITKVLYSLWITTMDLVNGSIPNFSVFRGYSLSVFYSKGVMDI